MARRLFFLQSELYFCFLKPKWHKPIPKQPHTTPPHHPPKLPQTIRDNPKPPRTTLCNNLPLQINQNHSKPPQTTTSKPPQAIPKSNKNRCHDAFKWCIIFLIDFWPTRIPRWWNHTMLWSSKSTHGIKTKTKNGKAKHASQAKETWNQIENKTAMKNEN